MTRAASTGVLTSRPPAGRRRRRARLTWLLSASAAVVLLPAAIPGQVTVVNVIPRQLSGETSPNPEPSIAVNPLDPRHIVIAVVVRGDQFCAPGGRAPLFVSRSGGRRWSYSCVIPRRPRDVGPFDVAFEFGPDGVLYGAHLATIDSLTLRILYSRHPIGPDPMDVMFERNDVDQPWIEVVGAQDAVSIVVSGNDKRLAAEDTARGTGALFVSRGALRTGMRFGDTHVEHRRITGQNYAIRLAGHRDGTLYAIYYSPRGADGSELDIVLARDDSAARDSAAFDALRDLTSAGHTTSGSRCERRDGRVGFRVVRCRTVPFQPAHDSLFGQERRVAANLSVAVDPRNSRTVYVAWADSVGTAHYTLHVRRSLDGGAQWSDDLLTVDNATNPALAIDSTGTVGFSYQQLTGEGSSARWVTRLQLTDDAFATARTIVLASVPASIPIAYLFPYIGDYMQLVAVGTTFYGAFSASNVPHREHFPNGVIYQRRADFARQRLLDLDGKPLQDASIDPFFFSVGKNEDSRCGALRTAARTRPQSSSAARARERMATIGCRAPRR